MVELEFHHFIHVFDRARILRSSLQKVATMDIDWWSQTISAPCCASILCCSVFSRPMAEDMASTFMVRGALVLYTGIHCTVHCPLAVVEIRGSSLWIQDLDLYTIEA